MLRARTGHPFGVGVVVVVVVVVVVRGALVLEIVLAGQPTQSSAQLERAPRLLLSRRAPTRQLEIAIGERVFCGRRQLAL